MAKLKVGDEVLIYDVSKIDLGLQYWHNGDIVRVIKVDPDGDVFLSTNRSSLGHFIVSDDEYPAIRIVRKVTGVKGL